MITEEVVQGPGAIAFRDKDPSAMHRGHEAWLNGLKQVSENRTPKTINSRRNLSRRRFRSRNDKRGKIETILPKGKGETENR